MSHLVLVRHGVTDWNMEGRWQGLTDTSINEKGRKEAREAAKNLKKTKIDVAYTSGLSRTKQTYDEICSSLGLSCPVFSQPVLNERDYGIYTGKYKQEVERRLGHEKFIELRRGWNYPIPKGEALLDVYNRVVPFYKEKILKDLKAGKNVLVVSSGNTLRALIKYLENLSDEEISDLELATGEIYLYRMDKTGKITGKEVKTVRI